MGRPTSVVVCLVFTRHAHACDNMHVRLSVPFIPVFRTALFVARPTPLVPSCSSTPCSPRLVPSAPSRVLYAGAAVSRSRPLCTRRGRGACASGSGAPAGLRDSGVAVACALMMSTLVGHDSNGLGLLYHASSLPPLHPCIAPIGWRLPTARSSAMELELFPSGYPTLAAILAFSLRSSIYSPQSG